MTSGRADGEVTRPGARTDWRPVLRLLVTALAMSALMSGTVLWFLRRRVAQ